MKASTDFKDSDGRMIETGEETAERTNARNGPDVLDTIFGGVPE